MLKVISDLQKAHIFIVGALILVPKVTIIGAPVLFIQEAFILAMLDVFRVGVHLCLQLGFVLGKWVLDYS